MRLLFLLLLTVTIAACCIVPLTPNPLRKPPLPVIVPRVHPYRWGSV